jgi:hypothetical protein
VTVTVGDGNTIYAWQVQEPDGRWSMVGALIPELGTHSPLVHRDLLLMRRLEGTARGHAEATGQPLRLARFDLAELLELKPPLP